MLPSRHYRARSLSIKHQAPNLDALSPRFALIASPIDKRRMGHSSRDSIPVFRIIALNQQTFVRRLVRHIPPLVIIVPPYIVRGTLKRRVDVSSGNEIARGVYGAPIDDAKGRVRDWVGYGAPHVDETKTGLKEYICSFWEMTTDSFGAGFEGLVDVNALLSSPEDARSAAMTNAIPLVLNTERLLL